MNATLIRGIVRDGKVDVDLPDGTVVTISPNDDDDRPPTPEEIARDLAAMDRLEPLEFTLEETSEWEIEQRKRKEMELARFNDRAEKLKGMWE